MLRRLAVLSATALALAGCSNFRDLFSAHADVVARAAGQELTASHLAELLAPQKAVQLRREVMDRIADLWVDYELLGQAVCHVLHAHEDEHLLPVAGDDEVAQQLALALARHRMHHVRHQGGRLVAARDFHRGRIAQQAVDQ